MVSGPTIRVVVDPALTRYLQPEETLRRWRGAGLESLVMLETDVVEHTPVDTSILRGSIFQELRGFPAEPGRVAAGPAAAPYVATVEFGRRAGARMPPLDAIAGWVHRVLGTDDRGVVFLVARAISRRGIKGKNMFANAAANRRGDIEKVFARWFQL